MRIIFWAGFAAFITDQLTKYIVVHAMELSRVRSIDVFPPLLTFVMAKTEASTLAYLVTGPSLVAGYSLASR